MKTLLTSPVRFYRYAVIDSVLIARRHGVRELLRARGWKFVAAVFTYYLVRDTLLYVVVPLCVARGADGARPAWQSTEFSPVTGVRVWRVRAPRGARGGEAPTDGLT